AGFAAERRMRSINGAPLYHAAAGLQHAKREGLARAVTCVYVQAKLKTLTWGVEPMRFDPSDANPNMDMQAHLSTYSGFLRLTLTGIVVVLLILIAMAVFLL